MKFRSDAAGFITGVRFYKSEPNTGTHVGHLWTSAGALLGTATFTGETASGWQQVNFPTGIAITANTTYIVSYSAPVGHYSDNGSFFAASVDNPPLHALANGTDGPNGVYIYSIGAFPNQTYNSTNYWVDPVFNLTATVQTWTISGTVSPSSAGSGTVLTLSGASSGTATADSSGNFSFSGLVNGSYTVTPSKTGFVFSPVSQLVTIGNGNVTSINFTASSSGIAIGSGAVDAQGNASIDIAFTSAGQAVAALQFDIGYPDQVFAFSVSSGGAANNSGKTIYTSDLQPGSKRILIAGLNQNPIGNGVLATLSIQANQATPPGFYPLAISNVVASDGSGSAVSVSASGGGLVVPGGGAPAPAILGVANAASYVPGPVAPGEMIVISGTSLGAATTASLQITPSGLVATSLAETRVLFDGIAAPLVYTTQNQLAAIVPYEVDGNTQTVVQVEYQGIRSAPFVLGVAKASPGIFTVHQSGTGQGAIVNEDGSINGPGNPALRGTVVSIFATGEGQTAPPGVDGSIVDASALRRPLLPVTVAIGGQSADVAYAGSAGGQISGLIQVNVRVPVSTPLGDSEPVTITIGSASQPGVTMAVQ